VDLSWINVGTAPVGITVWYDNGLGLDNLTRVEDPNTFINQTTTSVNAPSAGYYIWRVDTYDDMSVAGEPNGLTEGDTMYFFASDDAIPAVDMDTVPTVTWIAEPTPLQVTVKDDGKSDVTVTWTAKDDNNNVLTEPDVVFTPATIVIPAQADYTGAGIAAATSMTCDYQAGVITVTARVSDSNPLGGTNAASVGLFVASTPCAGARAANGMNLAIVYPADNNADCKHDLADFAALARDWQLDYTISEPKPDNR
jgi:hypothetical protein